MLNSKKLIQEVRLLFKGLWMDKQESSFIRHNKRIWENFLPDKGEGEILVELFHVATSIISFSYLANLLAKKNNAKIKAYIIRKKGLRVKIHFRIISMIYKSFNAEVFCYDLTQPQLSRVEELFKEIYPKLKNKKDVEKMKVGGIWIGDLLYDSHLMRYRIPTVNIEDPCFHNSLREALSYYIFWRDYFDSHNVKSVIVSHSAYAQYAIILRIAIQRGIPGYQIHVASCYFLSKKHIMASSEYLHFPEQFRKLTPEEQECGLEMAKKQLGRRFGGEVGVDMRYSNKSAYTKKKRTKVLSESSRIKILIAVHCFFDSPHGLGIHLFPDFYEWLSFLGMISVKTDYDWFIKTHPDVLPGNIEIIEKFIRKYPKFTLIPAETSHIQLIEEGIDFALTVYGTIGFEYAALGIPVVNASRCNLQIRYNFNIHPKTVKEYKKILLDLPNQKLNIVINQVYEYYYMAFIANNIENWLFSDYDAFLKEIGGFSKQYGSVSYKKFMEEFSTQKHDRIKRSLMKFIESKEYSFQRKHIIS